jgi:hypothetical protein
MTMTVIAFANYRDRDLFILFNDAVYSKAYHTQFSKRDSTLCLKLQGFVKNKNDKKNHGVIFRFSRVTKKNKNPHDHS